MRVFRLLWFVLGVGCLWAASGMAAEFKLLNGDAYRGEAASFDDFGVVIRREIGGFTPKIGWGQFTQETLKELVKNPQAAKLVEPFIDTPPEPKKEKIKKEIVIKDVPRLERLPKTGLFASLGTPVGLLIVAVLFLVNLYGAYEVAVYRQRPAALVCGVSAVLPFVGPIIFLSLPSSDAGLEAEPELDAAAAAQEALVSNPLATGKKTGPAPAAGLGIATDKKSKPVAASLDGAVFKRGETTFNRRFFESKLAGFFPLIATGPEKDLMVIIRTGKQEYAAKRITRISMTDMHVQVLKGGTEAQISFTEIQEIQVRRRDSKA